MKTSQKIVVGILAHVDAGKTTLSEALLYHSGSIRKMGRVDNGDAFLDTNPLEKSRGITIFSKQAVFSVGELEITLLDTPGHTDFGAEMERCLQVLDYAILVVSGADGVQGHTKTLWRLLRKYQIPTFVFVNKMDQQGCDKESLLAELKQELDENCVEFNELATEAFYENLAVSDETVLEHFLETGMVDEAHIRQLIWERKVTPCYFGSALKGQGVEQFLRGLAGNVLVPDYPTEFGAKIFKIARDENGNRLTYLKVTGGSLKVRTSLQIKTSPEHDTREEKVNQIRIYSGERYEAVTEVAAGTVCAVTGLTSTKPGEGLGIAKNSFQPVLEPVLTYQIQLPEGMDAAQMLPKLHQLEEEEPELHIVWDEQLQELQVQIMGEVQIEILASLIKERYDVAVTFGTGNIVYKETIQNTVCGVGHFEPLRHYAEVHLLLEPLERGSGLQFESNCSEDMLGKNWQRLVVTHLEEKTHRGVLTGAAITDMRISLIAGRAHLKHTEGGDFRQATYRAVRQGLMQAESVLLEPYYEFRLEIPEAMIGRAMTDIDQMFGKCEAPQIENGMAVLNGTAPVSTMREYPAEVIAYTRGNGRIYCFFKGYDICHNAAEVIAASNYEPQHDLDNPTGSVFCAHGAGFVVDWDEVPAYMHVDWIQPVIEKTQQVEALTLSNGNSMTRTDTTENAWLGTDEIDAIIERTSYANSSKKGNQWKKTKASAPLQRIYQGTENLGGVEYLLVDGYNVIFAWEDLKELAAVNIDGARGRLLDILCDYQGLRGCKLIVVFDAYRVVGHETEQLDYHNIHVVYTKEAETADQYIEKFAHENGRKYRITVATSDGLEQIIIRGQGCLLLSARELREEIKQAKAQLQQDYMGDSTEGRIYLSEQLKKL